MKTSVSTPTKIQYRPDIDGLRAAAVICVVTFHAFPSILKSGFIGVDIFFVISGYLISLIIAKNLEAGTFSIHEFYSNQVSRIFPALLLVLVSCLSLGWFTLLADEYSQLGKHTAAGSIFVSNIVLRSEAGYFDNAAETKPLLHLWSLGIEEQFYIVWPLLLWLAWQRKWNTSVIAILIATASFIHNVIGVNSDAPAAFFLPHGRFWELFSGGLLAWHERRHSRENRVCVFSGVPKISIGNHAGRRSSDLLSLMGFGLLLYGLWWIDDKSRFPGTWALVPVVGTMLIIHAGPNAWFNRTVLSRKAAVWLGLISFPLYLWHWPLLSFARILEGATPRLEVRIAAVVAAIVLAGATYQFIERPLRGMRAGSKALTLGLLMTLVGYAGYSTYMHDGLKSRAKVQSTSILVNNLNEIGNPYDYFDYRKSVRDGICHSVSLDTFKRNKCLDLRRNNILIWGDSYAASLYSGMNHIRNLEFRDVGITQMTDGNGPPFFVEGKTDDGKTLIAANNHRLNLAKETRPQVILITWMAGATNARRSKEELAAEINKTIDKILDASPTSRIIVLGPFPKWQDSLRKQLISYHATHRSQPPVYMSQGLDEDTRTDDRFFERQIQRHGVTYISVLESMCNAEGCLTRTSDEASDLTAVDWGHLTTQGSIYLANKIKDAVFRF